MRSDNLRNFIKNDSGETLVEILVAFMVLIIVVAAFTGAVNSASAATVNSIDRRRTYDSEYSGLRQKLSEEDTPGNKGTGLSTSTTLTGCDGNITLTAYQYTSGGTTYWVFR